MVVTAQQYGELSINFCALDPRNEIRPGYFSK
jgi:hypothetical protein